MTFKYCYNKIHLFLNNRP